MIISHHDISIQEGLFFTSIFLMMQVFLSKTILTSKIIIDAGFQSRLFCENRENRLFPTQGTQKTILFPLDDFRLLRTLLPGLSFRQVRATFGT